MKKFFVIFGLAFVCITAFAHSVEWYVDGSLYQTTTCDAGDSITPPVAPTKYGYTFDKWVGYIKLEYIESTGTQYIDTGITLKGTDVVEVKYSDIIRINSSCMLFGYYDVAVDDRFAYNFWQSGATGGYIYYKGYQTQISTPPTNDGLTHIIKMGNGSLYHDNTLVKSGMDSDFSTSGNMFIFDSSGIDSYPIKARVYYTKITDNNGMLVFNGIPVRRSDDNAVGMYDTVSKQFFTNAGTGEFIAGPDW